MTPEENHYATHRMAELITHWLLHNPTFLRELSRELVLQATKAPLGVVPEYTSEKLSK